jgi:hypothetical protein
MRVNENKDEFNEFDFFLNLKLCNTNTVLSHLAELRNMSVHICIYIELP